MEGCGSVFGRVCVKNTKCLIDNWCKISNLPHWIYLVKYEYDVKFILREHPQDNLNWNFFSLF